VRDSSDFANGWTVGGGEYAIGRNVSLGVGLFRSRSGPLEDQLSDVPLRRGRRRAGRCGDIKVQSLTARLNYRFGG